MSLEGICKPAYLMPLRIAEQLRVLRVHRDRGPLGLLAPVQLRRRLPAVLVDRAIQRRDTQRVELGCGAPA